MRKTWRQSFSILTVALTFYILGCSAPDGSDLNPGPAETLASQLDLEDLTRNPDGFSFKLIHSAELKNLMAVTSEGVLSWGERDLSFSRLSITGLMPGRSATVDVTALRDDGQKTILRVQGSALDSFELKPEIILPTGVVGEELIPQLVSLWLPEPNSLEYKWFRSAANSSASWEEIDGANYPTYLPTEKDWQRKIKVHVTAVTETNFGELVSQPTDILKPQPIPSVLDPGTKFFVGDLVEIKPSGAFSSAYRFLTSSPWCSITEAGILTASKPTICDVAAQSLGDKKWAPSNRSQIVSVSFIARGEGSNASVDDALAFDISLSSVAASAGGEVGVSANNLLPGSEVTVTIFSEPRVLGRFTADASGNFSRWVRIPSDLPEGAHTVVVEALKKSGQPVRGQAPIRVDRSAPSIVSVTPNTITAVPNQTITWEMIFSDAADIRQAEFFIADKYNPDNWTTRLWCLDADEENQFMMSKVGDVAEGEKWRITCTLPDTVLNGTYEIRATVSDVHWNTNLDSFESPIYGTLTISGGSDDRSAPSIVSVTPNTITAVPNQTITWEMIFSDAADIRQAEFFIADKYNPDNWTTRLWCLDADEENQFMMSKVGDVAEGEKWRITCTLPDTVLNGTYEIRATVSDVHWNTNLDSFESPIYGTLIVR